MSEKRSSARILKTIEFSLFYKGTIIKGETKNISVDGALLLLKDFQQGRVPHPKELIAIHFSESWDGTDQKSGNIVRSFDLGDKGLGLAIRFQDSN